MSYFGVSGPAQDGGFIAGIGAGAQRLNNARAARASYSKTLAGRVSRGFGQATDSITTAKVPLDEFLQNWRVYIKWTTVVRLRKKLELNGEESINVIPFYININDISGIHVQQMIDDYIEQNTARVRAENPGQAEANIEIYAKLAGKRAYKNQYTQLFEQAGYESDDALVLAQSAVNLHQDTFIGRMPVKTKELVYTHVLDPSEKEATAEYVVNQGRPQNTTQYAVYGVGLVAIGLLYRSRRQFRGSKARQGAFYGVFS